jgi:hypothetical protein
MRRLSSALRFTISVLALLWLGSPANAVTPPYQLITPTGTAPTDTAALNAALSTCVSGQAIFIEPGFLEINATIDLRGHDGCSITGALTTTSYDSSSGAQQTVIDCSGLSGTTICLIMGNSQVLRGLSIHGNGYGSGSTPTTTNCIDLSSSPASGNLFLDLTMSNCGWGFNIAPATCCSQNNRGLFVHTVGTTFAEYCGANCQFNQLSNIENEANWVSGIHCDTGCSKLQSDTTRGEDAGTAGFLIGTDMVLTNFFNSQENCAELQGSNIVMFGGRCAGSPSQNACFIWIGLGTPVTNVILRDMICNYQFDVQGDNINYNKPTALICNNCMLDLVGQWQFYPPTSAADPFYDPSDTSGLEAALDWQRPSKSAHLGTNDFMLPSGTATSAPVDFLWSPNPLFGLSSLCPCTISNPVYAHDGQSGIYEVRQDSTGGRTISWGSQYTVTSGALAPNTTANSTTYYPYTVSGTQVILGNSYHN